MGLIVLYLLTEWAWIWGVFFALWVIMDVRSGQTHLLESISKKQNPVLYWVIVVMWALLGAMSLLYYLGII